MLQKIRCTTFYQFRAIIFGTKPNNIILVPSAEITQSLLRIFPMLGKLFVLSFPRTYVDDNPFAEVVIVWNRFEVVTSCAPSVTVAPCTACAVFPLARAQLRQRPIKINILVYFIIF